MRAKRASKRARFLRTCIAAAFSGLVMMAVATPASHAGAATAQPQEFVELHGSGAWSVFGELVPWRNQLTTASQYVNMSYVLHGSNIGRQDLINAKNTGTDFAITGVPFSADELKNVTGGASAFISAPVAAASLGMFTQVPAMNPGIGFFTVRVICDPDDPSTWPPTVTNPDGCLPRAQYHGPIRIPTRNLASMILFYAPDGAGKKLYAWDRPEVLQAFGLDPKTTDFDVSLKSTGRPALASRSDPDETMYYLQQWIKATEPDLWAGNAEDKPQVSWDPISEFLPGPFGGSQSRDGAEQQVDLLGTGVDGRGVGGQTSASVFGAFAPAPPALLADFNETFHGPTNPTNDPGIQVQLAEMQNATGSYVKLTPDSVTKAIAAGGAAPNYAATHSVAGAYPLAWVDRLYAPAHGLSIAKTEGIAMLIRYLATTGQTKTAAAGDGQLSTALVAEALDNANKLVQSNCPDAKGEIVQSSDPGPLAPPTATEMKSIGPMLHCEPPGGVATTTTTTVVPPPGGSTGGTSGNTGSGSSSDFGSSGGSSFGTGSSSSSSSSSSGSTASSGTSTGSSSSGSGSTSGSGGTTVVVHKKSGSNQSALIVATNLPLPQPDGTTGADRLATFLLGVGLFLLLRKPATRLVQRIGSP
jgi:hypothetical protein